MYILTSLINGNVEIFVKDNLDELFKTVYRYHFGRSARIHTINDLEMFVEWFLSEETIETLDSGCYATTNLSFVCFKMLKHNGGVFNVYIIYC
jgi:hypothetical protein